MSDRHYECWEVARISWRQRRTIRTVVGQIVEGALFGVVACILMWCFCGCASPARMTDIPPDLAANDVRRTNECARGVAFRDGVIWGERARAELRGDVTATDWCVRAEALHWQQVGGR